MKTTSTQANIWNLSLRNGLITGAVLFAFTIIFQYVLEMYTNYWLIIIPVVGLVLGIYFTHRDYKEMNGGLMSYGRGLGLGVLVGVIAGLLIGILSFLYTNLIDPETIQAQADAQVEVQVEMLEKFGAPDEQIDQALDSRDELVETFQSPIKVISGSILNLTIFAFIIALIVSAFTKRKDPSLEY
jgi:energy-coupling factor transporter transmembrane protein EcfT